MIEIIKEETTFVLDAFPKLAGKCLGGSAALSLRLTNAGVPNYVALGSLTCRGIQAFTYTPLNLDIGGVWDGHAWVVIEETIIMDVTLIKTARERPDNSNVKKSLKHILERGAIGFKKQGRFSHYEEFIYEEVGRLPDYGRDRLIRGLLEHNGVLNDDKD